MNQELKKIIGTIKVAKGITQSEIATTIGVKPTYLSDMINDRVPYSESMKKRIYEIYSDCLPAPDDAPTTEQQGDNFARKIIETLMVHIDILKEQVYKLNCKCQEQEKYIEELQREIDNETSQK